ncbi:replication initiator [Streptomyces canus]|uniref:replication initiator n=1 Tax=Streptomyces canus TaxID=58343 RepID=UPI0038681D18
MPELANLAAQGTLPGILRQLSGLGGCIHPIRLDGHRTEYDVDTATGEIGRILQHLDSTSLPAGQLLVRCNNRRTTRCPACAEVYRRDTFHLITAGLRGGKGTPEQVGTTPACWGLRRNRPLRHRSLAVRIPRTAPGTEGEPTRG